MAEPLPLDHPAVDALLAAGRALVAIGVRSLQEFEEITFTEYQALVFVAGHGPQRVVDIGSRLNVHSSTATRIVDRLVKRRMLSRTSHTNDRRTVVCELLPGGVELITRVSSRRRAEYARLLGALTPEEVDAVIHCMSALAVAADEVLAPHWKTQILIQDVSALPFREQQS